MATEAAETEPTETSASQREEIRGRNCSVGARHISGTYAGSKGARKLFPTQRSDTPQ